MIVLLFFAFLSGLTTILAPCIWPILPIVLSFSTVGKNHLRPLGVTTGVMVSFSIFTLVVSFLVMQFHLDPNVLRLLAVVLLVFFGITMIVPALTGFLELLASRLTQFSGGKVPQRNDFLGGFFAGLSLGILWSPCAGPILATIATIAIAGQVTINVVLITISYALGVGIPLFIFAYGGQRIFVKTRFLSPHTGKIQRIFGVFTILVAIAIYTNYDKLIQTKLLDLLPQYSQAITQLENNDQVKKQLDTLRVQKTPSLLGNDSTLSSKGVAPEFSGITKWLNTDHPLTLKELKGKVVLIDFWTYTCINCIRTLPHVTSWYEKYKDKGFIVIGVHTPEFEFEKDTNNVKNAIGQFNIHYPVAQDNDYATWNAYSNHYWPAHYLIDSKGIIRETHFGEGNYEETEKAIQTLLSEVGKKIDSSLVDMPDQTPTGHLSPETYLGSKRMQYLYPNGSVGNGKQQFTLQDVRVNSFSLGGEWDISDEYVIAGKNATLNYGFMARKVFLVMRPGTNGVGKVRVYFNGKIAKDVAGEDVKDGVITIDTDRLYKILDLSKTNDSSGVLKLEFLTPGIQCFAFTFG